MLLIDVPSGQRARITNYGDYKQRQKLLAMGLTPGRPFVLRIPGHSTNRVLDCEGCTIALNDAMARSIQVSILN